MFKQLAILSLLVVISRSHEAYNSNLAQSNVEVNHFGHFSQNHGPKENSHEYYIHHEPIPDTQAALISSTKIAPRNKTKQVDQRVNIWSTIEEMIKTDPNLAKTGEPYTELPQQNEPPKKTNNNRRPLHKQFNNQLKKNNVHNHSGEEQVHHHHHHNNEHYHHHKNAHHNNHKNNRKTQGGQKRKSVTTTEATLPYKLPNVAKKEFPVKKEQAQNVYNRQENVQTQYYKPQEGVNTMTHDGYKLNNYATNYNENYYNTNEYQKLNDNNDAKTQNLVNNVNIDYSWNPMNTQENIGNYKNYAENAQSETPKMYQNYHEAVKTNNGEPSWNVQPNHHEYFYKQEVQVENNTNVKDMPAGNIPTEHYYYQPKEVTTAKPENHYYNVQQAPQQVSQQVAQEVPQQTYQQVAKEVPQQTYQQVAQEVPQQTYQQVTHEVPQQSYQQTSQQTPQQEQQYTTPSEEPFNYNTWNLQHNKKYHEEMAKFNQWQSTESAQTNQYSTEANVAYTPQQQQWSVVMPKPEDSVVPEVVKQANQYYQTPSEGDVHKYEQWTYQQGQEVATKQEVPSVVVTDAKSYQEVHHSAQAEKETAMYVYPTEENAYKHQYYEEPKKELSLPVPSPVPEEIKPTKEPAKNIELTLNSNNKEMKNSKEITLKCILITKKNINCNIVHKADEPTVDLVKDVKDMPYIYEYIQPLIQAQDYKTGKMSIATPVTVNHTQEYHHKHAPVKNYHQYQQQEQHQQQQQEQPKMEGTYYNQNYNKVQKHVENNNREQKQNNGYLPPKVGNNSNVKVPKFEGAQQGARQGRRQQVPAKSYVPINNNNSNNYKNSHW